MLRSIMRFLRRLMVALKAITAQSIAGGIAGLVVRYGESEAYPARRRGAALDFIIRRTGKR